MKHIWCCLLFIFLIISCQKSTNKNTIEDYIFSQADYVLTINNLENFKSNITNNHFIDQLSNTRSYKNICEKLELLNQIKSKQKVYVNLFKDKKDSLQYSFVTKLNDTVFNLDSLKIKREPIKLKGLSAEKITNKNQIIYVSTVGNLLIGANNVDHLQHLINSKPDKNSIKKIIATQDKEASFSVYTNTNIGLNSIFVNKNVLSKNFTDYLTFDTEIGQNQLILNGITKASDTTNKLLNVFKNTLPQDNQLAQITPSNSDGFLSVTFNDYKKFSHNLNKFNKIDTLKSKTTLFDNIVEFGEIYSDTTSAVVLNSIDIISTQEALLSEKEKVEDFRGISIYKFSKPGLFNDYLKPFVNLDKAANYFIINQFLVFASNTETLENIIVNYQNQTTINDRDYYKDLKKNLSNQASILQVINPINLSQIVKTNLNTNFDFKFDNYKTTALQFIYDIDFAHFNAIIKQSKPSVSDNSVTEMFNIKLDNDILTNPQFVKNHRTKQKDIIVQDIANTLYLISNSGKILWKKQLKGAILGSVNQIDMYKNGRLQLVFATANRVYVLDHTGEDVKPFPMTFNDDITQPLSVFDYDNNKKYRLFITQDKNVLVYDSQGKTVKGFNFKKAEETINTPPQHIRIGPKDYLLFKTDNQLYILDRRGKTRVTPKTKLSYANQAIFNYNSDFITTTKDGKLATIDQKGKVTVSNTNLSENINLSATTKTLITQSDNTLNIKDQTLQLDFGSYTPAKLFLINNKIYVSTTDKQTQKVMLFDSNAKQQDNFPVYGTSAIDLDNIDKDNNLEFVTKGESNSVLVYKIN